MVQYNAGIKESHQLPRLSMATPKSTGIPALPAEFWRRSLCLANISGVTVAASSNYNPNTNKGTIAIRALQGLNRNKEKSGVASKSTSATTTKMSTKLSPSPPSPMAADTQALRHAVSGPPSSVQKSKAATSRIEGKIVSASKSQGSAKVDSSSTLKAVPSQSAATVTHVSPDQKDMKTPMRPTTSSETTPDSTEDLPKISKFLQPKRITEKQTNSSDQTVVVSQSAKQSLKKRKQQLSSSPSGSSGTSIEGQLPPKKAKSDSSTETKLSKKEKKAKKKAKPSAGESTLNVVSDRKRDRPSSSSTTETFSDVDTAKLLANLKSPPPSSKHSESKNDDSMAFKLSKTGTIASKQPPAVSPAVRQKPSASLLPPKLSFQNTSTGGHKEAIFREQINAQYKELQAYIESLTSISVARMHSMNARGPVPSVIIGSAIHPSQSHLHKYNRLKEEHQATHVILQKRLLRSAEMTLRLLLDRDITAEEARTELKANSKRYQEILYDTLHRQTMERESFLAKNPRAKADADRDDDRDIEGSYPCQSAFAKVEEICSAISRPVGRPRNTLGLSPTPSRL